MNRRDGAGIGVVDHAQALRHKRAAESFYGDAPETVGWIFQALKRRFGDDVLAATLAIDEAAAYLESKP